MGIMNRDEDMRESTLKISRLTDKGRVYVSEFISVGNNKKSVVMLVPMQMGVKYGYKVKKLKVGWELTGNGKIVAEKDVRKVREIEIDKVNEYMRENKKKLLYVGDNGDVVKEVTEVKKAKVK